MKTTPRKKHGMLLGLLALATIAVLAGCALFERVTPLLTAQRSLSNLSQEFGDRIQTTPLHALPLLARNMIDGTTSVSFDYTNRWGERTHGTFTLVTDYQQEAILMRLDLNTYGIDIDFEMFMNSEHAAARTDLLGRDFYGITFATFRDDFTQFAREMGLDEEIIDALADFVEELEAAFEIEDLEAEFQHNIEAYQTAIADFIRGSEYSSSREDGVNRIEFRFEEADIYELLEALLVAFENDETLHDLFDDAIMDALAADMELGFDVDFNEIVDMIRDFVADHGGDFVSQSTLVLYVGNENRLNRLEMTNALSYEDDPVNIDFTIDFGAHALDAWTLNMALTFDMVTTNVELAWVISEDGGRYVNTATLRATGINVSLESDWNTNTGGFTLAAGEDGNTLGSFGGNFTTDSEGGFRLRFNEIPLDRAHLSIQIQSEAAGAVAFPSSFINIRDWNVQEMMETVEATVFGMMPTDDWFMPTDDPTYAPAAIPAPPAASSAFAGFFFDDATNASLLLFEEDAFGSAFMLTISFAEFLDLDTTDAFTLFGLYTVNEATRVVYLDLDPDSILDLAEDLTIRIVEAYILPYMEPGEEELLEELLLMIFEEMAEELLEEMARMVLTFDEDLNALRDLVHGEFWFVRV